MEERIIIIGAGATGLSAALELAQNGVKSVLVSDMPSERAQSAMAEGGMNAAAGIKDDSPELHAQETLRAGRFIADSNAVLELAQGAPEIIEWLFNSGMSFSLNAEGRPDVRAFGGQSKKRTFFAASNTGKHLMYTLIDQARRFECKGLIERIVGWQFLRIIKDGERACGCVLVYPYTHEQIALSGKVIIASGGLNGMFGNATGSVGNTGAVSASLFADSIAFANCEFVQYHPTTSKLHGKNMLITEAVRGEGGRLFVNKDGQRYYFMEDKYPERGNLMPRDVIAREEWALEQQGLNIYLDMSHLDKQLSQTKLHGVIEDCRKFLSIDPTCEPIPVTPGVHYFMGGIKVTRQHRTSLCGLYAAGECACQYHGANRLGGNSLLGAIYGGKIAARSAMADDAVAAKALEYHDDSSNDKAADGSYVDSIIKLRGIMRSGMSIVRNEESLKRAIDQIDDLSDSVKGTYDPSANVCENRALKNFCLLGKAMLLSAQARKESRGAHTRSDFPGEREEYQKQSMACLNDDAIAIAFESAGELE